MRSEVIEQAAINAAHRRHLQTMHTDLGGQPFVECRCGRLFDTEDEALRHWWRAAHALQRAQARC